MRVYNKFLSQQEVLDKKINMTASRDSFNFMAFVLPMNGNKSFDFLDNDYVTIDARLDHWKGKERVYSYEPQIMRHCTDDDLKRNNQTDYTAWGLRPVCFVPHADATIEGVEGLTVSNSVVTIDIKPCNSTLRKTCKPKEEIIAFARFSLFQIWMTETTFLGEMFEDD